MIDDDTKLPVDNEWTHIWPEGGVFSHDLVGTDCWCKPEIDHIDMIVIHRCEHELIDEISFH